MASKQVIVIRKDLNMRKGKMVAQGSHASLGVLLNMLNNDRKIPENPPEIINGKYTLSLTIDEGSALDEWLRGTFTKICVSVNSEKELFDIYEQAKNNGLPCTLIQDAGFTEFNGVPTYTAVAIGPDDVEKIDLICKHLPLL
jgi:PTH2 family peptidyl-tRNA hydrolase